MKFQLWNLKGKMKDKLEKLKEDHQIEVHKMRVADATDSRKARAFMFLGGVHAVNKLVKSLDSNFLRGIQAIEEEKLYVDLGFDVFVDFLDSEYSPMSKSTYYNKIKILETEGDNVFNLMNEIGVSVATRKLLAAGNYDAISFDGDQLKIGEETADLSNIKMVRALIEAYATDLKKVTGDAETKQAKLEKAELVITAGTKELSNLQRKIDAEKSEGYGGKFARLILELSNFASFANSLSDAEKADKRDFALKTIADQFGYISESFGVSYNLTTGNASADLDELTAQIISEGFEDED